MLTRKKRLCQIEKSFGFLLKILYIEHTFRTGQFVFFQSTVQSCTFRSEIWYSSRYTKPAPFILYVFCIVSIRLSEFFKKRNVPILRISPRLIADADSRSFIFLPCFLLLEWLLLCSLLDLIFLGILPFIPLWLWRFASHSYPILSSSRIRNSTVVAQRCSFSHVTTYHHVDPLLLLFVLLLLLGVRNSSKVENLHDKRHQTCRLVCSPVSSSLAQGELDR